MDKVFQWFFSKNVNCILVLFVLPLLSESHYKAMTTRLLSNSTPPNKQGHAWLCTRFNRTNHTIETCFLKHGTKNSVHNVANCWSSTWVWFQGCKRSLIFSLNKDQIQSLFALLPSATPNVNSMSTSNMVTASNIVLITFMLN